MPGAGSLMGGWLAWSRSTVDAMTLPSSYPDGMLLSSLALRWARNNAKDYGSASLGVPMWRQRLRACVEVMAG